MPKHAIESMRNEIYLFLKWVTIAYDMIAYGPF